MMVFSKSGSLLALLWAGTTLATPLLESLFGRDTSNCPKTFVARNGLNFINIACNQNNKYNDAWDPFVVDSMEECMEQCSRFWNEGEGEGCFGIVYTASKNCWIRNSTTSRLSSGKTVFSKPLLNEINTHSALVDRNQMKPLDTDCPAADLSRHSLPGVPGVEYTVQCNKDIGGSYDTCWGGYPSCANNPFQAFYHATSLEDCLSNCVKEHPLCRGVIYNPGLEIGYANCWPKTGFSQTLPATGTRLKIVHSATLTTIDTPDTDCTKNKTYTSTSDDSKNFAVHCGQANQGTNMTSFHSQNFTSCMEACADNKNGCVGVVYDSSLNQGFQNCYLQNTSSVFTDADSSMYAVLGAPKPDDGASKPKPSGKPGSGSGSGSGSNSPSGSKNSDAESSSSKAWIAGAVVGPILGLALIGAAIWFFRRRKNSAAASAGNVQEADAGKHNPYVQGGPAPAYAEVPEYNPREMSPTELANDEHHMSEMEGGNTAKYANKGSAGGGGRDVHELQ